MNSIWTATTKQHSFPALEHDAKTDVLIIGGGMAGILCAYLLHQAGIDYMLVEANHICSGITKGTTAKITVQHGLIYHKLIKKFGEEIASLYLQANTNALNQFAHICKDVRCSFEQKDSFIYSCTDKGVLEAELNALRHIGYPAEYVSDLPLPMPTVGAVKFPAQAQFHPLEFTNAISRHLHIYEHTKVTEYCEPVVKTNHAQITAKRIVVATHFPIFNKHGAYALKMYQSRSYMIALKHAQDVNGMYMAEDDTGLSFRNVQDYLLLGGGGHRTGHPGRQWTALTSFANLHYPKATEHFRWATQDCMTLDAIPYIGPYKKNAKDVYVMTGFQKWGMTSSMVAAHLIRDLLLDNSNEYPPVFDPHRSMLHPQLFINLWESTKNIITPSSRRCPHMGCALKWNEAEHSWDCPCHGSRFQEKGELIDNPATDDLPT